MMGKKKWLPFLMLIVAGIGGLGAQSQLLFNKSIASYIMGDTALAVQYLNEYLAENPQPSLKNGFDKLFQNKHYDATEIFEGYLSINHRSIEALVGIGLSTRLLKNSTAKDLYLRAIRLQPNAATPYACAGFEAENEKNYPQAEYYYQQAVQRAGKMVEFKILLAQLFYKLEKFKEIIDLLKSEVPRFNDHFQLHYFLAKAAMNSNQTELFVEHLNRASHINPTDNELKLLQARHLLQQQEYKQAEALLNTLKFKEYHHEYTAAMAQALLKLDDKRAYDYVEQIYYKDKWDIDSARLMCMFQAKNNTGEALKNSIKRAVLAGVSAEELRTFIPESLEIPQYPVFPFFQVSQLIYLTDDLLAVFGSVQSGDANSVYIFDAKQMKILQTMPLKGQFQQAIASKDGNFIIIAVALVNNETINLLLLENQKNTYVMSLLYQKPFEMKAANLAFDKGEQNLYFVDKELSAVSFESPFSHFDKMSKKTKMYPKMIFPVYKYNLSNKRLSRVSDANELLECPLKCVQKYMLVCTVYAQNDKVRDLIDKGMNLETTANEVVRIFFSPGLDGFVVYLSDLTNAFVGVVYRKSDNRVTKVDQTDFIGKGKFAKIDLFSLFPDKNEMVILIKEEGFPLIQFNYQSLLKTWIIDKPVYYHYYPSEDCAYILNERSRKKHYLETNLLQVDFSPYAKKQLSARTDIEKLEYKDGARFTYFVNYHGELIRYDENNTPECIGVSVSDLIHSRNPKNTKKALFLNRRLVIMPVQYAY
jgi:thioredoxin-like negative regulator of GroEL